MNTKNIIVFTDCGDTLIDEARQTFSKQCDVLVEAADMIEGAKEELEQLKNHGFRVAMVADGLVESFDNIVAQHALEPFFEIRVISEALGCQKPDARMFTETMRQMGLTNEDIPRIVMIGNNIKRDVAGANRLGICSVLLTFSPRYSMIPETQEETPDYLAAMPCDILPLMEALERRYQQTGRIKNAAAWEGGIENDGRRIDAQYDGIH